MGVRFRFGTFWFRVNESVDVRGEMLVFGYGVWVRLFISLFEVV